MAETSFKVAGTGWQLDGAQRWCFRLAKWLLFGTLLVGLPIVGLLDGHVDPDVRLQLISIGFYLTLLGAPGLAVVGMVLETTWFGRAATVSVQGKLLVVDKGGKPRGMPLRGFRSGWVLGAQALPVIDRVSGLGIAREHVRGGVLELETTAGNLFRIKVDQLEQARELLAATRLDARHRVLEMRLGPSDFLTALLYLVGPVVSWLPVLPFASVGDRLELSKNATMMIMLWLEVLVFLGLRGLVQAFMMPARLTIGSDGVTIVRDLRRQFLPFASLRDWRVRDDGVIFTQTDGKRVMARGRHLWMDGKSHAVAERLEEARRVHLRGHGREEVRQALARGSQSLAAWRHELDGLLKRTSYRDDGGLREEDLREVLESPSEPAAARIGAALALRASDERMPRRLRVLAATCASEPLRRALVGLAASEVDDETLEAALAADDALPQTAPARHVDDA